MNAELELRDYLAILRVRRWTIVAVVFVVGGAALAFSFLQTPMYRSSARVLVKPIPAVSAGWTQYPNLKTETELMSSEPIAGRVAERLGGGYTQAELVARLRAHHLLDTEVIVVEYTSPDPDFARDAADAFATEYIVFRREQALNVVASSERSLRQRLEEIRGEIEAAVVGAEEARQERDNAAVARYETERSVLTARLGVLEQQLDQLRPDLHALEGGEVIQPAALPSRPASPSHTRNGVLGGVLGLMLGIGLAFIQEYLNDRFRGRSEIEGSVGVPELAAIPRFDGHQDRPVIIHDPKDAAAEAYRSLRTNLDYLLQATDARTVLITSPGEGEGKTSTTANLGVAFAQMGRRVVLVSADMRRPALERHFDVPNGWGLSSWLADAPEGMWPSPLATPTRNLDVLPSGPVVDHPTELLASARFPALMRELSTRYDIVLVDSSPALLLADASVVAAHLDVTVLVVNAITTPSAAAVDAKLKLERVGARIVGCVLNAFDPSDATSGYAYGYRPYEYAPHPAGDGHTTESAEPRLYRSLEQRATVPPEAAPARGRLGRRVLRALVAPSRRDG